MTSATATCFRFAILLSHRIVGWSRPSSAQQPSRTKGVTLLGRVSEMVLWSRLLLLCTSIEHTLVHISSVVSHVSDLVPPKVECGPGCRWATCADFFV